MKIGIVSDSHGKVKRLRGAVAMLVERGAEAIVHCGDAGSGECIAALTEAGVPAYAVAGNMDRRLDRLQAEAEKAGVQFSAEAIFVALDDGTRLAATHGDKAHVLNKLLADATVRYLCCGHTHQPRDERIGATRLINPGALRHAHPPTAAILDTEADTVEHIKVR